MAPGRIQRLQIIDLPTTDEPPKSWVLNESWIVNQDGFSLAQAIEDGGDSSGQTQQIMGQGELGIQKFMVVTRRRCHSHRGASEREPRAK
ncbi:hypothetical protein H2204_004249 [Knufia peltigerae]|uniref:Uncharacterized protein n=1 Tax=Knufia peltigerae TaxID=1002370 RepID=A0AA39D0T1_9EURO|nr:hypothetical protein H2204_004249 [Knufia peltigerae]